MFCFLYKLVGYDDKISSSMLGRKDWMYYVGFGSFLSILYHLVYHYYRTNCNFLVYLHELLVYLNVADKFQGQ